MKYVLKTAAPTRTPFDLDADLNVQQRTVVRAPPGRLLVIAGAGTGKTRTLVYRVAKLLFSGCPPERILLCTFTNRAAREMVSRVEELVGAHMQRMFAGTFHHIGNRLLRRHAEAVGLSPDFSILDPEDARTMLSSVIADLGLKQLTARRFPPPKALYSLQSLARGKQVPVADVIAEQNPKMLEQLPTIEQVLQRFAARKLAMNACDFDDLLGLWHELMTQPEHAKVAEELGASFSHVLVDEYQDVSALQGSLCERMADHCGSLTVVGGDAQSIYGFRGADFRQIAEFGRRHAEAQILTLTINYRSTPEILALANRSIARNRSGHRKDLSAVKQSGMLPAVIPLRDVYQQAELVAQRVLELHHDQALPLAKMAVLYRNHGHSLELQVELSRRGIPFAIRSGVRFFEQAHIKDVVAYLRARQNPRDALSWVRLLKQWPGVGAQTADRMALALAGLQQDTDTQPDAQPDTQAAVTVHDRTTLRDEAERAKGRGKAALLRLSKLWDALTEQHSAGPGEAIRQVLTQHYGEYAERTYPNATARREDLEHLAAFADSYPSTQAFLDEVALVQGVSAENVGGSDAPQDQLVLSTVHQAMGLEWPIVFLLALADGRFPSAQALRTDEDIEEERRLFYVAVTRAADELYLCYPTMEEGRDGPSRLLRASRFVTELDRVPRVFDRWDIEEAPTED
ncbi:MAG: ATP-dependent helicase [Nannocystaceae bacterium]|nr:ATP-dependent helicase [Nannocystaceae bacterium]